MEEISKLSMRKGFAVSALAIKIATFAVFSPLCETIGCTNMVVAQKQPKKDEIVKNIDLKPIEATKTEVFSYLKSSASQADKLELMKKFVEKYGEPALDSLMVNITLNFGFNSFETYQEATKDKDRSSQFAAFAYGIAYFKDRGFERVLSKVVQLGKTTLSENYVLAHGIFTEAVYLMVDKKRIDLDKAGDKIAEELLKNEISPVARQELLDWLGKISPSTVCDVRDRAPVGDLRTMTAHQVDYLTTRLGAVPCKKR